MDHVWWMLMMWTMMLMYDVWCMIYDVWCLMYDVYCTMHDVWCLCQHLASLASVLLRTVGHMHICVLFSMVMSKCDRESWAYNVCECCMQWCQYVYTCQQSCYFHMMVSACAHVIRSVLKRACSFVDNSSHLTCVSVYLCCLSCVCTAALEGDNADQTDLLEHMGGTADCRILDNNNSKNKCPHRLTHTYIKPNT